METLASEIIADQQKTIDNLEFKLSNARLKQELIKTILTTENQEQLFDMLNVLKNESKEK